MGDSTHASFWQVNLKARGNLEDSGVDGRIILKWILKTGSVEWIRLAHENGAWRAVVKTVMNFQAPQNA
jgi:hypothetical protein